jgi:hypothetical protein
MATADANRDISAANGARITAEAASWNGTPYALVGSKSTKGEKGGGDCSGTTWLIYSAAGFQYEYQTSKSFPENALKRGLFREVAAGDAKQDGDILWWNDHMAIYSTFMSPAETKFKTTARKNKNGASWTQTNDMWTASHPGGLPFRPAAIRYFGKEMAPRFFRWVGAK